MQLDATMWTGFTFLIDANDGEDQIVVLTTSEQSGRKAILVTRASSFLARGTAQLGYVGYEALSATQANKWLNDVLAKYFDEKALKNIIAHYSNPQMAVRINYAH